MEVVYEELATMIHFWKRLSHRTYYTLTGYPWRWAEGKDKFYECCEAQICADIRASGWNPEN